MDTTVTTMVIAILASNGLFAMIQYLITRHDAKKNIKGKLDKLEKDGLRTQLLLFLLLRPDEQNEILTLGQRYFSKPPVGLDGNWYMTGMFAKWCTAHNLEPEWFDGRVKDN